MIAGDSWTPPDWCGVCERVHRRCRFGDPRGLCACWRGEPCADPPRRARLYTDSPRGIIPARHTLEA